MQVQFAAVSPDQRWLAYTQLSQDQTSAELYVSPFPGLESRWQISNGGSGPLDWLPTPNGLV
jgi:hypothetical protein